MKGRSYMHWRGRLTSTTSVFLVAGLLACAGEQRSGAAPADTAQAARETAVTGSDTTAGQPRDTAPAPDTAAARRDTTTQTAAKPTPPRPARPRTARAAQPRTDTTASTTRADTSRQSTAVSSTRQDTANAARVDTATTAQSETTSATPAPAAQANAPVRDPYHRAPLDTVPQQVYDGWKQYNLNCARCHGEDVMGTTIAPHLLVSLKPDGPINTKELFVQTVCAGRPAKGMPAWCPLGMEMPTIEAIYAYVKGRSDAKLRPGRPALKAGG
jgi:hypothetical protein